MKQLPEKYHTLQSCAVTWNLLSDKTRGKYERYVSKVPYTLDDVDNILAYLDGLKVWPRIDTIHGILYQDLPIDVKQQYYAYYLKYKTNTYVEVDFNQLTFRMNYSLGHNIIIGFLYGHLLKDIRLYIESLPETTESINVLDKMNFFERDYGPFPVLYTFRGEGLRFCKIWFHENGPVPEDGNYLDVNVNGQMIMYLRHFKNVAVIDYDTTQRFFSPRIAEYVRAYGHGAYLIQTMKAQNGIRQSHFCKLVKSIFGVTPTVLRHLDTFNPVNGKEKLRADAFVEQEMAKAKKNFHSYRTQQRHYAQTPTNVNKDWQ